MTPPCWINSLPLVPSIWQDSPRYTQTCAERRKSPLSFDIGRTVSFECNFLAQGEYYKALLTLRPNFFRKVIIFTSRSTIFDLKKTCANERVFARVECKRTLSECIIIIIIIIIIIMAVVIFIDIVGIRGL